MPPTKPAAKKKAVRLAKHPRPVTVALTLLRAVEADLSIASPAWLRADLLKLERMLTAMDASTGKPDAARTRHARKR